MSKFIKINGYYIRKDLIASISNISLESILNSNNKAHKCEATFYVIFKKPISEITSEAIKIIVQDELHVREKCRELAEIERNRIIEELEKD